jgi:Protein of unknown function (DUF3631)
MHAETYSASIDDLAEREAAAYPIADRIDLGLCKLDSDPGAIFERDVLADLIEVRQNDPARYQRVRAAAKSAKASVGELDKLTMPKDDRGSVEVFADVEPWPEPVDGAVLLADMCAIISQHVIADKPTILAAALWCVHSWCMDALTVSPLAHITAPEKRCGKTILLTAMSRLVYRPLPVSNISPAALFRSMELWQPTLLIDEADTFLRDNEEARGLINSGLYKESAFVLRVEGDAHIPTLFRTWGSKVICGIGKQADTIEDRSIPLRLRRKVAGESVVNIRHSDAAIWENLRRRMARWAEDNRSAIASTRPAPALGLNDRAQDCWEPLLAIADLAGEEWAQHARSAAQKLHGIEEEAPSINAELLRDIKEAFERRGSSRLASALLIELLTEDDELPWATWNRGFPMKPRQLAQRLAEFGIKPKTIRVSGASGTPKGYDIADFRDAFTRYLSVSAETPCRSATTPQPHNGGGSQSSASATTSATGSRHPQHATSTGCLGATNNLEGGVACGGSGGGVADRVAGVDASQTAPLSHCGGVADEMLTSVKKNEGEGKVEGGREVLDL